MNLLQLLPLLKCGLSSKRIDPHAIGLILLPGLLRKLVMGLLRLECLFDGCLVRLLVMQLLIEELVCLPFEIVLDLLCYLHVESCLLVRLEAKRVKRAPQFPNESQMRLR